MSNFLFPLNGRVVLSLPCCTPDRDHLGTPRPPLRLHTHLPNTNASAHHPTLAHEPLPQPADSYPTPTTAANSSSTPSTADPPPPTPHAGFPKHTLRLRAALYKSEGGRGRDFCPLWGLPALAYGEEATGRPSHWVFGGLISLPTALGVRVLWLRKGRKKREWD